MTLQQWLAQRLQGREWLEADLARALDVRPGTVNRWMHGTIPKPQMVERIAEVFHFDTKMLMQIAGYIPEDADDPEIRELTAIMESLPGHERQAVLEFAAFRREMTRRRSGGA